MRRQGTPENDKATGRTSSRRPTSRLMSSGPANGMEVTSHVGMERQTKPQQGHRFREANVASEIGVPRRMPTESSVPDGKRPVQFSLRTLLLIVSVLAAALAVVRWLGAEVLPFILVAGGVWLTARTKARHLFVWLVPSLWSLCAFGSWHHPGDEYGMFCGAVLVSLWLVFLLNFGHLSEVYLLLIAAGLLPMAVFGFLLDRLPVSRRVWAAVYVVASVALFAWGFLSYPSLAKAISKNGSISAYVFCAANLGMYVSVLTCLSGGTVVWSWRQVRRKKTI